MRLQQNKVGVGGTHLLVRGASLLTLLILGAMIFPTLPQTAQAEEAESKVSLNVAPVISLSLQGTVAVEVTPTQDGTFRSNTAALSISTNNETGYSLYMATGNGENTLTSQNPGISNVISAVNGGDNGVTSANFTNNTWGYNLSQDSVSDAIAYKAVPTATGDTAIITTSSPTEADTYNLTFGTKVDTSLPSGTYSNDVVVSVVANPATITSLTQLTYMQDMTPEICASSTENDTARLTDIRDGKQYWVAKLADGNCWMTQNLDLNLSTSKALTPDDSDVPSSWTPERSTTTSIFNNSTDNKQYSWDPGYWVKSDPDGYSNYCSQVASLSDSSCTSAGWTDVSSMTPMTDGTTNEVISTGNNTYNAHYLVGNLYQWNAATAGTGGPIANTNATGSICPKGWQLPFSGNSNSGSFGGLVRSLNPTTITQAPYYFNPSGSVSSGSLWGAGSSGNYWSSTARSLNSVVYNLHFASNNLSPSYSNNRYLGFSVRCLAR